MIKIRKNVFETNSSSTHSIAISKKKPVIPSYISFSLGEYCWEADVVDAKDYLWTAICLSENYEGYREHLETFLYERGIKFHFEEPKFDGWGCENATIDHHYDTLEFVNACMNNDDLLERVLFNYDSMVYTGNDNNSEPEDMCNVEEYDHPRHDEEKYEYFYKGN